MPVPSRVGTKQPTLLAFLHLIAPAQYYQCFMTPRYSGDFHFIYSKILIPRAGRGMGSKRELSFPTLTRYSEENIFLN